MHNNSINFSQYQKAVRNYVETGMVPDNVTKSNLMDKIAGLTAKEKQSLKNIIEMELPHDEWAYIGPAFESIPSAGKWAVLAGIAGGTMQYQFSKELYSAAATGFLTSAVTFLGQLQYKKSQAKNQWDAKEQRANEFLNQLSKDADIIDSPATRKKFASSY